MSHRAREGSPHTHAYIGATMLQLHAVKFVAAESGRLEFEPNDFSSAPSLPPIVSLSWIRSGQMAVRKEERNQTTDARAFSGERPTSRDEDEALWSAAQDYHFGRFAN